MKVIIAPALSISARFSVGRGHPLVVDMIFTLTTNTRLYVQLYTCFPVTCNDVTIP
jgi:hypothetical protein